MVRIALTPIEIAPIYADTLLFTSPASPDKKAPIKGAPHIVGSHSIVRGMWIT
jgi:hypothetical protein